MAFNTPPELKNAIVYELFIRNHTEEGTFEALIPDLDRIKALGTDIIWLMPIHPIGIENRKGTAGSPYSISDYREVNPEYGTIESFVALLQEIHSRGMKVVLDVVFHHAAYDSKLAVEHPEWIADHGRSNLTSKVDEWTDVVDLDFSKPDLWDYLVETLKFWVEIGVDGFRCDVASLIPMDFWRFAREEIEEVKKECVWLAETVDPDMLLDIRKKGFVALSDCELYAAFDMTYDYDGYRLLKLYLDGDTSLAEYLNYIQAQDYIFPANYVKMRFSENHDTPRSNETFTTPEELYNWTAFQIFQKGAFMLYSGQEKNIAQLPSMFEKEAIDWSQEDHDYNLFIKRMLRLKKTEFIQEGEFIMYPNLDFVAAKWEFNDRGFFAIFNPEGVEGERKIYLPDGVYSNYLGKEKVEVRKGKIQMQAMPIILRLLH